MTTNQIKYLDFRRKKKQQSPLYTNKCKRATNAPFITDNVVLPLLTIIQAMAEKQSSKISGWAQTFSRSILNN